MKRRSIKADEYDAFGFRRWYFWQSGEIKKIKRRVNKRERREGKRECRELGNE